METIDWIYGMAFIKHLIAGVATGHKHSLADMKLQAASCNHKISQQI
jgi:hypothetical protein